MGMYSMLSVYRSSCTVKGRYDSFFNILVIVVNLLAKPL